MPPIKTPRAQVSSSGVLLVLGSICGVVTSLGIAKLIAMSGGLAATAKYSLILSIATLVAMLADANVGQGLISRLSEATKKGQVDLFTRYIRSARSITTLGGLASVALLGVTLTTHIGVPRKTISGGEVILAAAGGAFMMASNQELNILAGSFKGRSRAKLALVLPLLAGGSVFFSLVARGVQGLAFGFCLGSFLSFVTCRIVVSKQVDTNPGNVSTRSTTAELIKFGVPMTLNVAVGFGLTTLQPIILTVIFGSSPAGLLKAALGITGPYMAVITLVLASRFYPQVAGLRRKATLDLLTHQVQVLLAVVCPLMVVTVLEGPLLVRHLYSSEYGQVTLLLPFLLLADVFRIASWTIAFSILAHAKPKRLFVAELVGGLTLVITSTVLYRPFGIVSLGIGALASAFFYFCLVFRACSLRVCRPSNQLLKQIAQTLSLIGFSWLLSTVNSLVAWIAFPAALYQGARIFQRVAQSGSGSTRAIPTLVKQRVAHQEGTLTP